jgi:hypothetical protein
MKGEIMNYKVYDKVMITVDGDLNKYVSSHDIGEIYAVCSDGSTKPYYKVKFGCDLFYAKAEDIRPTINKTNVVDRNKYGLYKRIMKRDFKAIDEIKTLEQAKEIINMMTGNVYLNGKIYNQLDREFQFGNDKMKDELNKLTKNRNEEYANVEE